MRIKRAGGAALMVALVVLLAACGGGGNGEESSKGGKTLDPSKAENASGSVDWCIGKDTTGAFAAVVKLHNQQNPNVKAKLVELPTSADEQRTQQIQRLRAKSPECDVLGMDTIWTAEYASQGWIYDVTKTMDDRKDEFIPSTVESATYQDKYWGIPFDTNAGFLYYRSDQVNQAPKTWQEVYQQAKANDGLIYQGMQYEGLTVDYLELLYTAGGKVISDDGKKSEIDSPEARDALALMVNGVKDGAVPKANSTYDEEGSRRAFEAGKATFLRNWPYVYALANKSGIKGKFGYSTLPGWEDKKASGVIGGINNGINAYSDNPGAALEFANFVSQKAPQVIIASKASLPSTRTDTYDDPTVKKALPFAEQLRTAIQQAHPRPNSPVYTQISEAIYKNVYAALQGSTTPDAAVSKMSDQIDSALKTF